MVRLRRNRAVQVACPRRQAQPSRSTSERYSPQPIASLCTSTLSPLPYQAFLCHRGDERSIAFEYKSAREAARALQIRRILRVKQPLIRTERPVEPQGMIKTGGYEFLFKKRATVRRQCCVEQHHVRRISQHALVNRGKIRQLSGRANPYIELSTRNFLAKIPLEFDGAKLNRALTFVVSADGIRHHWQHFFAHVRVTRELFWWRD